MKQEAVEGDSAAVEGDSAAVVGDSAAVEGDSAAVLGDSAAHGGALQRLERIREQSSDDLLRRISELEAQIDDSLRNYDA